MLVCLCLAAIVALILINAEKSSLDKIKQEGRITILTRNSPTTYYEGPDGKTGFEYDLARLFADYLGVDLKIQLPESFNDLFPMINGNQADLIAAGLTVTEPRKSLVRFAPPYQDITQQLIYRLGDKRPKSVEDIIGGRLEVVAGSSFEERLRDLKAEYPELNWVASEAQDVENLLQKIAGGEIDYTVVDSNEFEHHLRFYPELRVAFDISEPQQLAWAFRTDRQDDALYNAAVEFFNEIQQNGTLTRLLERHYSYVQGYKPVETTLFLKHVQERLPPYKFMFMEAGATFGFDWRLLAALAFQESHWLTNAVSPTGVRGMMMLTERTAGQMKVMNRLDARESIIGGAAYLKLLHDKLPEDIYEPDRTWMALAAYNVGAGHLEDARKITESQGGDPHKWIDVRKHLPLLSKREWYKKTRFGYARGREPVVYVRNIRRYYDILIWLDERIEPEKTPQYTTSSDAIISASMPPSL
ncbi:MAG TPA: membrane-bound lytic murein transglycosylase MltF [Gammaproteobacteria bacterium]